MLARLHRLLAGDDGPGRRALPVGELMAPVPLAALGLLALNDRLLKGAGILPPVLTGKLSDFAGLLAFPLLLTAVADVVLLAAARVSGRPIDFTLRRGKLMAACAITALIFAPTKIWPAAANLVAAAHTAIGLPSTIVCDPTDLIALPMIAVAYLLGRREIARVPLGRIAWIEQRIAAAPPGDAEAVARRELADVVNAGADPAAIDQLARGLAQFAAGGAPDPAAAALRSIRAPTAARPCPP